jgi:hypothetical protein
MIEVIRLNEPVEYIGLSLQGMALAETEVLNVKAIWIEAIRGLN